MSEEKALPTGEKFEMSIEHVVQERINSEKVRTLLKPEQISLVVTEIEFDQMKLKRKAGKVIPFKIPNLQNATVPGLIDQLGEVREQIKNLKKEEGILKAALEARLKD